MRAAAEEANAKYLVPDRAEGICDCLDRALA
jgi:hypothetical protein